MFGKKSMSMPPNFYPVTLMRVIGRIGFCVIIANIMDKVWSFRIFYILLPQSTGEVPVRLIYHCHESNK